MQKRRISYSTARLIMESAAELIQPEVGQQWCLVTTIEDIDVQPGTMLIVKSIDADKDELVFKVVDKELEGTTTVSAFAEHAQLQSTNVNEAANDSAAKLWSQYSDAERARIAKIAGRASEVKADWQKMTSDVQIDLKRVMIADGDLMDEALSPAQAQQLTTVINTVYAMVNYAHVMHNNVIEAPNVNAVHLALETLYTELPALADELGEACRFDYDIILDASVTIAEPNPVQAIFDLRQDLLGLQSSQPGYINSMIDAINGLLTSVLYKMTRLGGLAKPTIVVVND